MKRWMTVMTRGGSVLIVIGLALLLVSFISSGGTSASQGSVTIHDRSWVILDSIVLTPQTDLILKTNADARVDVILLQIESTTLDNWINGYDASGDTLNLANLQAFVRAEPEAVLSNRTGVNLLYQYAPIKVVNITIVASNPTVSYVTLNYQSSILTQLSPVAEVRSLAEFAIPLGLLMATPGIAELMIKRKDPQTLVHNGRTESKSDSRRKNDNGRGEADR